MTSREIVHAVKVEFPKFSPAALSLARRPQETGVTFVQRAAEIVQTLEGSERAQEARKEFRRKSIKFHCRLSPVDARSVKNEMARRGVGTVQELLEALLLEWAEWSKKEPIPVSKTGSGSEVGADAEASPASENTTNDVGGQT